MSGSLIVSDWEIAIASPSFASLFFLFLLSFVVFYCLFVFVSFFCLFVSKETLSSEILK